MDRGALVWDPSGLVCGLLLVSSTEDRRCASHLSRHASCASSSPPQKSMFAKLPRLTIWECELGGARPKSPRRSPPPGAEPATTRGNSGGPISVERPSHLSLSLLVSPGISPLFYLSPSRAKNAGRTGASSGARRQRRVKGGYVRLPVAVYVRCIARGACAMDRARTGRVTKWWRGRPRQIFLLTSARLARQPRSSQEPSDAGRRALHRSRERSFRDDMIGKSSPFNLDGKCAVVTGGTKGLGCVPARCPLRTTAPNEACHRRSDGTFLYPKR